MGALACRQVGRHWGIARFAVAVSLARTVVIAVAAAGIAPRLEPSAQSVVIARSSD